MADLSLNGIIQTTLDPVYHGGDVTTNLYRWMIDVGIPPWSNTVLEAYLLSEEPALSSAGTLQEQLLVFFRDYFSAGVLSFRLLEDGSRRLLETSDRRLLEV